MSEAPAALLGLINLTAFVLYGIDKHRAVRNRWRIPESVLILSAVLGGGIGAYLGMRIFHHKTRKPLFALGVPLIMLAEYALLAYALLHNQI